MMKVLFCMTSDFKYDQRMQRIVSTFDKNYDCFIFNRGSTDQSFHSINANCFFNKGFLFYIEFNFRLLIHLFTHQYDIIYLVDTDTLFAGGFFSLFGKRKYIFDSHEWFTEVPELNGKFLKKYIWKFVEKLFIPRMNLCITVTETIAEKLSEIHKTKFYVIRNISKLRSIRQFTQSKKIILYQGAVNLGRGLECAIEAMSLLNGFELHIYGDGDIKSKLVKKVEELKIQDKVLFFPKTSPHLLWEKSCEAYIGLNLLENNSKSYYFSLANKFFDYIHAHVPSINMDFPEYRRILKDHEVGIAISALEPTLLADKIMTLDNQSYRNQLIKNCINAKESFNWEKEEVKLLTILNELN
jgi:glycosyltransferase involved in cell wall biosynthesis